MTLWIITITVTCVFVVLLALMWLRKLQFDAVHKNFLELSKRISGKVLRNGFAERPRFSGKFKGQDVTISFTTESSKKGRNYYITLTMQAKSKINFTVLSSQWLNREDFSKDHESRVIPLKDGEYLLETSKKGQLKKLNTQQMEEVIHSIHPFAYILMAKSGMILERTSTNIATDTHPDKLFPLLEGMYHLKMIVE
ncbi:MAG: hypothetical protein D6748_00970 [Calditrichaeota bacterium]|nr:MAG: hypothetical protein D6748_00970 [Calditrichota bacterium]